MSQSQYRRDLLRAFWSYQSAPFFAGRQAFDRADPSLDRPPVFLKEFASENVLSDPGRQLYRLVLQEIPARKRHRWFRSMSSSQALAQSVFGYLKHYQRLDVLARVRDASGRPIFYEPADVPAFESLSMEHEVTSLREPRPTSVDAFFRLPNYRVAVECKLSEHDVGACSRTKLRPSDPSFSVQHCNGLLIPQRGRSANCTLSELGIAYWDHIPKILHWTIQPSSASSTACPLKTTYQLVRNILAACVTDDGALDAATGHAVLIYDARNPSFANGAGCLAWETTQSALREPSLLRRCTWQDLLQHMNSAPEMRWLVSAIGLKYGLRP